MISEATLCQLPDGHEIGGKICYSTGKGGMRTRYVSMDEFEDVMEDVEDRPDQRVIEFMKRPAPTKQLLPYDYSILSSIGQTYLYEYQKKILHTILTVCGGRALVGMEQGTGKTPLAVAAMAWYGTPGMYVVPGGKLRDFANDHKLLTGKDIQIIKTSKDDIRCGFIVATPDMAKIHEGILQTAWQTIIVDEAHKLSGDDTTLYAQKLIPLFRGAKALLMMTGTPEKSRHADLFLTLTCLHPRVFPSRKDFTKRYCDGQIDKFGKWDVRKSRYGLELRLIMSKFMVRCTKKEVLTDLPPKKRVKVVAHVTDPEEIAWFVHEKGEMDSLQRDVDRTAHIPTRNRIQNKVNLIGNEMWRRSGQVKVKLCKSWLINLIQSNPTEKFILFCVHHDIAIQLIAMLEESDICSVYINGKVPSLKRDKLLEPIKDETNMDVRVAVLTMCCAEGINLWMCTRVIMVEYPRTPGTAEQAEDRAHRKGVKRPVTCYYLHAEGSRDADSLRKLIYKSKTNNLVVSGEAEASLQFDEVIQMYPGNKRVKMG